MVEAHVIEEQSSNEPGTDRAYVTVFRSLEDAAFERQLVHPEHGTLTVDWLLQNYAWHGRDHTAHIVPLRSRRGWSRDRE